MPNPSVAAKEQFGGILSDLEVDAWDKLVSMYDGGQIEYPQLLSGLAEISAIRKMQRRLLTDMNKSIAQVQNELGEDNERK